MGAYTLRAVVTSPATGDIKFANGCHEIEYPHIQRRQVMEPSEIALKVIDVKTTPNVNVAYIIGVGDQAPAALEQLGAKVTYIEPDELAWGDLSACETSRVLLGWPSNVDSAASALLKHCGTTFPPCPGCQGGARRFASIRL